MEDRAILIFVGHMEQWWLHFRKAEPSRIVQLIDGEEEIAEMSTGHTQNLIVSIIGEEGDETLPEVLHVSVNSTFLKNLGQT